MTMKNPKKKGPWIDIALIATILSLTIIMIFLVKSTSNIRSNAATDIALAAAPDVTKEQATYPGIKIITEASFDEHTPYSIQYPQTKDHAFNTLVEDAVHATLDDYQKSTQTTLQSDPDAVGQLNISSKTIVHKKEYYSFVLSQTVNDGIGSKEKSVQTFMYDHKHNQTLFIQDLFTNNENLPKLATILRQQMAKDSQLHALMSPKPVKEVTKPLWVNFEHFSLSDESFNVYYDAGQLSEDIQNVKVMKIPLSSLHSILAKPFQVEVKTTKPANPKKKPTKVKKLVALTFDDGPSVSVTPKVLKVLKKHHAKATFFMLGSQVNAHPKIAKQIADAGYEIGNHSYSHPNLKNLTNGQIKGQLSKTSNAIKKATGNYPTLFRPPYGSVDQRVRAQTSLPTITWTVDTRDWEYRNSKALLTMVKKYTHSGDIVLMHDIHMSTANGLDDVLTYLEKQGYECVTVSELKKGGK